jgi:hypothetical protein
MSYKITIGDTMAEPDLKDCYVINLSYMHGDADLYTDGELGPFNANKDMDKLQEALTICSKIKDMEPNEAECVDGFDEWFNCEDYDDDEDSENSFGTDMDRDVTCDCQYHCYLDDFNLVYYDKEGTVHICYIEEEK